MKRDAEVSTLKMPAPEHIIAGRYRIKSRLGSGGMGLVFLAERVDGGEEIALKFLDPESGDEARVERFIREARAAVTMQHPNAAQVYDLGRDDEGRFFIAFELVQGEDLRELLRREGRLAWNDARDIIVQVASALAYAHDNHIVHRDVKPENVKVRRQGAALQVKLLDFGIARVLRDAGVRLTGEGMLAGTPRYMSPEQVKDEPIDGRTDVYALGLVFYELLTGAIAMGGRNVPQILMHQVQTPMPTLKWADPALDYPQVDAFLARACAKAPGDRFPTMEAFSQALLRLDVDEGSWPAMTKPVQAVERMAPTRDLQQPPPASTGSGSSDTVVRKPAVTELTPELQRSAHDVPTDPERPPVAPAIRLTESKVVDPVASAPPGWEGPTELERPMVKRPPRVLVKETVLGAPVPKKPTRWPYVVVGVGLGVLSLVGFGWWWLYG